MARKIFDSTTWLYVVLTLAFVAAFVSVGSTGLVHAALHQASIRDWRAHQRVHTAPQVFEASAPLESAPPE